jgi:hypothetical protein
VPPVRQLDVRPGQVTERSSDPSARHLLRRRRDRCSPETSQSLRPGAGPAKQSAAHQSTCPPGTPFGCAQPLINSCGLPGGSANLALSSKMIRYESNSYTSHRDRSRQRRRLVCRRIRGRGDRPPDIARRPNRHGAVAARRHRPRCRRRISSGGLRTPASLGGTPAALRLRVPDVDVAFDRAVQAGATVFEPVNDAFWGDRTGQVLDPSGHRWAFDQHIRDVPAEEIARRAAELFGSQPDV